MKQDGTLFTLENDELLVTVARHGAELTRIYDKKADREVLWRAEPSVWDRHAPVLFPFVGKCYGGTYVHDGKEYSMNAPRLCNGIWILNPFSATWTNAGFV